MRVLLVDPSARGGIATYTSRLSEALAQVGVPPTVLVSRGLRSAPAGAAEVLPWLPDHTWGRPGGATAGFYARRARDLSQAVAGLARAVRTVRPDVVHLQFGLSAQLDALLVAALRTRVPVVWTAHDVVPFEGGADKAAAALRSAQLVLVHTEPARQLLAARGCESTVVEHVPAAVPAGVDPRQPRAEARAQLGLPQDARLLAALGFVRAYKGYDLLADVWERLGPAAPRLLVMGEPWSEDDQAVLTRLARLDRVEVRPGYASDDDLARAARAADAVLLPYSHASDSGLLHLARAVGTPVLASDAPQLAASVDGTGAGAVVPRRIDAWAAAVAGGLPPDPPPPPSLAATGEAHLQAYAEARARHRRSAQRRRVVLYSDASACGGAEAVAAELVAGWAASWDVVVVGVDSGVVARLAGDGHARRVVLARVQGKRDLRNAAGHVAALRRLRPDVVVVNLQVPWAGQYAQAAALALRLPVVAVEHCPLPTSSRVQLALKRGTSARLAAHVAVSVAAAREVERVAQLPVGSVGAVPNGVRLRRSPPAALPPGVSRPCLVAAGRLDVVKGFDVLLRALPDLPGVFLWLLGEGEERGALEALAGELGVADRVRFEGWHADPAAAFAAADLVVVTSRWESSALVAAEALHNGAPLVVTDVGGLPELVGDGAVLVPPEDPGALSATVRDLLADEDRRRGLAERGTRVAASLPSAAQMVAAYDALLREVTDTSHQAS